MDAFMKNDENLAEKVYENEEIINNLEECITNYLVKLSKCELSDKEKNIVAATFHIVNDIERIGDHAENLAGKDAVFKVKVKEIKKRELPELDDDFASEVSEFDTMDEFRADVRKKLEEAAENKAKVETENAVIDKVIENAEFDLPDAMVETQIDNSVRDFAQRLSYQGMNLDMYMQYTGMTMDALRAQFAEQAKKQLSGSLVLEAIQKAEGIEAGPEEVELELVDMSKKYNMELDKLKELLGDAEKESIKKDLEIQKTITMIVNNAQVK